MGVVRRTLIRAHHSKFLVSLVIIVIVLGVVSNANVFLVVKAPPVEAIDDSALVNAPVQVEPVPEVKPISTGLTTGCASMPCLALTFDDGPNPIATPIVLQALEQAQVHATFFVVGARAVAMPGLLQQMHRDGDEIGNHSWGHPNFTALPADQIAWQVSKTQDAVTAAGVPAPTLFRPPYGAVNDLMRNTINLPFIMWNVDPDDWHNQNPSQIIPAIEAQAKPGAIVDLHDIYPTTGLALPQLLSDLKQHYKLVTVSELLNLQPGERGEFFAR